MKLTKLYDKAYDWLLDIGPKIIVGLIILFIGIWLIKMLRTRLRDQMLKKKVHSSLQPFFLSLTITSLYVLLIIVVMNVVGLELTVFTTIIGAFSVAAGLALSGTLQNFAGGVLILLLKPFGLDDNIVAQGQDGIVTSIQIFYTVLLTFDSKTVIIPNGKLFNEVIVNVTREGKRRLDFEIKLGYVANVEQVKTVIWNAIKSTPNVLNDPRNKVGISALEIDGVKFVVNAWVNPGDFGSVKLALQEKILNDLVTAGVKLPGV
ncbi:mechanosensitive ion channel family protein [Mucilaginibacter sp. X5P1]|uniref:mechanosensitive ion channel family protein n=1 Tax=Mucilaginibacter sp. X5P1 TaxID=2723088 RepID=UPI00161A523B|nr:mechanosensitive ion channel domain-containing protein [Mucilaginibacter sp. X5P1]MBB6138933.1 small conductance mechanosensitive channel [Mucilaginibacter sp. X5P1]